MRRLRLTTRRRQVLAALGAVVVLVVVVAIVGVVRSSAPIRTSSQFVTGTAEPGTIAGSGPVKLDTTLYFPSKTPAPAVLLAHGFGSSKSALDSQARSLARAGFVVLAYSARGFGSSTGLIHLDAPDYEVADARKLIDYLATRPEVRLDAPGDPHVGVAGSSYGGGLALLTAGYDHRVDAVAADITWNDLGRSLFPNAAADAPGGVFKKLWAAYLFGGAASVSPNVRGSGTAPASSAQSGCGRFSAEICSAYQQLAQGNSPDVSLLPLLSASSPASILNKITAPTLLTQGEQDSLFPLSEADANARGIAANGTPVAVRWRAGGHDTGSGTDQAQSDARRWFQDVLVRDRPSPSFELTLRGAGLSAQSGERVSDTLKVKGGYPTAGAGKSVDAKAVVVKGSSQSIAAPPGGSPAALSSLPGLSDLLDLAGSTSSFDALATIPGQVAAFDSDPLSARLLVTGASTVTLSITPVSTTDATLFVALRDVSPTGAQTLPAQLVNPISLVGLTPGQPVTVTVALPSVVTQIESGHRLRLTVSTTDQAYLLPTDPRAYTVALVGGSAPVAVPSIPTETVRSGTAYVWLIVGGIVAVICLAIGALVSMRVRRGSKVGGSKVGGSKVGGGRVGIGAKGFGTDAAPVVVTDLVKEYRDGFRAVDGVSFRVERGQIVGLLGPNGAGKTTTLRVLMGLIHPTSGSVEIFGAPATPGAVVLSRVGAFVEGPGLLPHLSGRANLRLYWAATGRPAEDAKFETALEIAGLGSSVDRRVKTYSQGMRQRLAIAQAMLGLPELLVLDEPTNGLDPPQIAEMRNVLRSYAATGRTVVVSSHLLAEVEQTCTHVVVMHKGRLVAAGAVDEVAGLGSVTLSVDDPDEARRVLAAAGIEATAVPSRRALEDVFLELVGE
ncbi:MAG: transporter related protein [Pseudonocardiales bacterium]|nr:transporter related protein [Pseudonocardiales bacterium]